MADQTEVVIAMSADTSFTAAGDGNPEDKANDQVNGKTEDTIDCKANDTTTDKTNGEANDKIKDGIETKGLFSNIKAALQNAFVVASTSAGFVVSIFKPKPRQPFPFEKLPLELRRRIYFLMMPGDATLRSRTVNDHLSPCTRIRPPRLRNFPIGQVSLAIRTEFYRELALRQKFYIDADHALEVAQCLNKLPFALHASFKRLDILIHGEEEIMSQIGVLTRVVLDMRHLDELTITVPRFWLRQYSLELSQRLRYMLTSDKVSQVQLVISVDLDEMFQRMRLPVHDNAAGDGLYDNPRIGCDILVLTIENGKVKANYS